MIPIMVNNWREWYTIGAISSTPIADNSCKKFEINTQLEAIEDIKRRGLKDDLGHFALTWPRE